MFCESRGFVAGVCSTGGRACLEQGRPRACWDPGPSCGWTPPRPHCTAQRPLLVLLVLSSYQSMLFLPSPVAQSHKASHPGWTGWSPIQLGNLHQLPGPSEAAAGRPRVKVVRDWELRWPKIQAHSCLAWSPLLKRGPCVSGSAGTRFSGGREAVHLPREPQEATQAGGAA